MRRILIVRFSALGDVYLTFRALQRLETADSEIHYLTKAKFSDSVRACSQVTHVHTLPDDASLRDLWRLLKALNAKLAFDGVVDLHSNLRSFVVRGFFRLFSRSKVAKLYKPRLNEGLRFLLRDRGADFLGLPQIDRVACYRRVLQKFLPPVNGPTHAETIITAGTSLGSGRYVAICTDSAWREKEWKHSNFESLARSIRGLGARVVWVGGSTENRIGLESGDYDFRGKLSVVETAAIVRQAKVLVSNDSGLMHVAESVGTRVVAIFGPTTPSLGFGPRLDSSKIVGADLWCRPCSKNGTKCFRLVRKRLCLDMVGVDEVFDRVKEALS